jgi:hypothetical protein
MSYLGADDCPPPPPLRAGLRALMLHEACESAGGVARLAQLLCVSAEVLAHWLLGEETPPEEIYRACADIVLLDGGGASSQRGSR